MAANKGRKKKDIKKKSSGGKKRPNVSTARLIRVRDPQLRPKGDFWE